MAAKQPVSIPADDENDALFIKIDGTYRGFKKEFLSQNIPPMMESILICPCCKGIMHNATVCQGSITCEACTRTKGDKSKVSQVVCTVGEISVKCPLLRQCEWSGKLSATEEHLDNCQIFRLKCSLGCGLILERSKEANHKKVECVKRKVECKYCNKKFIVNELEEHMKKCDLFPIKCPDGCGMEITKKDTTEHRKTICTSADVKCPYEKYGCKAGVMKRKDLGRHKTESVIEHQDWLMGSLAKIETENVNLKKELADTRKQLNARIDAVEKGVKK